MSINPINANNAYAQALKSAVSTSPSFGNADGASGPSSAFAAIVEDSISGITEATKKAEVVSAQAVAGNADLVDVVTAVSNAEHVVSTVTTVRDSVMKAYNDILKMPI